MTRPQEFTCPAYAALLYEVHGFMAKDDRAMQARQGESLTLDVVKSSHSFSLVSQPGGEKEEKRKNINGIRYDFACYL